MGANRNEANALIIHDRKFVVKKFGLILEVFRGAIKGALIALLIAFTMLSVLFGIGEPLMALYYLIIVLIVYVAPLGMLAGAVVTGIHLVRNVDHLPDKRGGQYLSVLTWIGIPITLIVGIVIAPYLLVNMSKELKYGATWTTEANPDCATPAVVLIPTGTLESTSVPVRETICSPELLDHLQTQNDAIVPIIYRITYAFGKPRSVQLTSVGNTKIAISEWIDSDWFSLFEVG